MKPIPEEAIKALPQGHYAFWGSEEEMLTDYEQRKATLIWSVGKYRPSEISIGFWGNDPANLYARPLSMKPGRVAELELELAAAVKERDELKQKFETAVEIAADLRREGREARAALADKTELANNLLGKCNEYRETIQRLECLQITNSAMARELAELRGSVPNACWNCGSKECWHNVCQPSQCSQWTPKQEPS